MGSFKKPFQLPPEVDVDVDAPSQPATGSRRPASTMANEEPKMSRRDRSGSLPSRLMGSRLMGLVLPIPKVERQAPEEGEELEPYIARLKVKVVKADGLLPCRDPYIICTYDHDQAVLISKTSISIDVHFDERKTHEKIHKWETSCYFDVRFKSSPIEFSIFDNGNSDQFLGRAQLLPRADRRADAPVSLPLEGREDFEHVSGTLLVDAHILEKRPDPHLEDFVIRDSERNIYEDLNTGLKYKVKTLQNTNDHRVYRRKNAKVNAFVGPLKYAFARTPSEIRLFVNDATSLYSILPQSGQGIEENIARFYFAEIILALEDLQECEPRHLFFKLDDICLDDLGHITFNDFNISPVEIAGNAIHEEGLEYMAPEIIMGKDCRWTTNFWSLGVIMFEICCGFPPFHVEDLELLAKYICGGAKIRIPRDVLSKNGRDLLRGLLNRNPSHRLGATDGFAELKSHPFFDDIDWEKLRRRDIIPPIKLKMPRYQRQEPDEKHHTLQDPGVAYGSLSSYRTAYSSFGQRSVYGTPTTYADIWSQASGPSVGSFLKEMFVANEEKEHRVKPDFKDLIRERGLQPSLSEEINWSGQGQHVQFGVAQNIPLKELAAIGHGGSALVDSVLCRRVKLARKTMMCTRRQKLETMINEVEHLQALRHPHIIQLVGSYLQGKKFAILLYPVAEWNLSRFLELCQEIEYESEGQSRNALALKLRALPGFLQCITHAMAYIHANTIKHMDMKPQNILVRPKSRGMNQFSVYLADFGISKKFAEGELSQTSGVIALTRKYCAPEVYDGAPRGRAADVFSLGCVFLEIATVIQGRSLDEFADFRARPINPGDDVDDDSYHGNLEKVEDWIENLRLIPDQGLEQRREITRTLDIIRRMIKWVPETRPTTPKVLEQLGGPRNCCVQEREAYEAEEEKTSISDSLRRMA